jgi:hypothetical protein
MSTMNPVSIFLKSEFCEVGSMRALNYVQCNQDVLLYYRKIRKQNGKLFFYFLFDLGLFVVASAIASRLSAQNHRLKNAVLFRPAASGTLTRPRFPPPLAPPLPLIIK